MEDFDWQPFLQDLSRAVLQADDLRRDLPRDAIESEWLGYPGATDEQIAAAETRLGTRLPPSYRSFLRASNGWRRTGPFIDRVWPTTELEWFVTRHRHWAEVYMIDDFPVSDDEYFDYGEEQASELFRAHYLMTALEISDVGDSAIYLLNPQVVTPEGEWEAWFFANWLPGAERFRSFLEMMQYELARLLDPGDTFIYYPRKD